MSNITGTTNVHKLVLLRNRVISCLQVLQAVERVSPDARLVHVRETLEEALSQTKPDWSERPATSMGRVQSNVFQSPLVRKQAD